MRICVARVGELKPDVVLTGHTDAINSVKWDPTGRLLASCSDDFSVKIWDPLRVIEDAAAAAASAGSGPEQQPEADGDTKQTTTTTTADGKEPTGTKASAAGAVATSAFVHNLQEHKKEVYTFRWSCTGPGTAHPSEPLTLASASFDGTVKIWDVASGACIRTFEHQYVPICRGLATAATDHSTDCALSLYVAGILSTASRTVLAASTWLVGQ